MYYRRKVILALLEQFGGQLNKIALQKTLFLLSRLQKKPVYDFIPYKYGCYSYQAVWDLGALQLRGFVENTDNQWNLTSHKLHLNELTKNDIEIIRYLKYTLKELSTDELIYKTYLEYPFWAINSLKAEKMLSAQQYEAVQNHKPQKTNVSLFTIGYEGISLESYFNKLIINDVKVLCDVRRNAISQKFGFSKSDLVKVCNALGIIYIHLPELGIPSDKRKHLQDQTDYDTLFDDYKTNYLFFQQHNIDCILDLVLKYHRVALTCFEASYCQCHRSKVAEAVVNHNDWKYELNHI
ncbi:DUF488 domain-containing protein [Larkinella knui]|uniref:DUF488 domain-containing protein n=1 Tax=Larkinella knui TaxID=2025310 RepID=A0A3P1CBU2_9BACT|nr:DUF488 domain-containing protein [Larkinella knui]RRB10803.1 DUF488 domain-containing protein [Larkinella knui]